MTGVGSYFSLFSYGGAILSQPSSLIQVRMMDIEIKTCFLWFTHVEIDENYPPFGGKLIEKQTQMWKRAREFD
jgi:hypothetical protein